MNSEQFKAAILARKPRYANARIPVIEAMANKGTKSSEYNQFGPIYELYIYAFILGLKKGLKLELSSRKLTTDFLEIGKWKRESSLVDFLLMIVFTRTDELGFKWSDLEDMNEPELNNVITKVVSFIETYANGGLEYLQKEMDSDNLINSHYMFVDVLAEASTLPSNASEDPSNRKTKLTFSRTNEDILKGTVQLIKQGEQTEIEFKSTLRVNLHTGNRDAKMEHSCMKTIAGFMNSNGGTLIIGVADNKEVLGLKTDFGSFNKEDKLDEFQKHLDNLIEKSFGNSTFSLLKIYFPELESGLVCRIDVQQKTNGPAYLRNSTSKQDEFYIRRAASTKKLELRECQEYIAGHWK